MSEPVVELVERWVTRLAGLEPLLDASSTSATSSTEPTSTGECLSDAERIELIRALEGLKAAAAAAQARVTAAFAASQREAMTSSGVPVSDQGRSIGAQVALARRVSPRQGSRHLGLAEALVGEFAAGHGRPHGGRHERVAGDARCPRDGVPEPRGPTGCRRGAGRTTRRDRVDGGRGDRLGGSADRLPARSGRGGPAVVTGCLTTVRHSPPRSGRDDVPHRSAAGGFWGSGTRRAGACC